MDTSPSSEPSLLGPASWLALLLLLQSPLFTTASWLALLSLLQSPLFTTASWLALLSLLQSPLFSTASWLAPLSLLNPLVFGNYPTCRNGRSSDSGIATSDCSVTQCYYWFEMTTKPSNG
jgi:hypothetical protein